jgi:hypothetical protein
LTTDCFDSGYRNNQYKVIYTTFKNPTFYALFRRKELNNCRQTIIFLIALIIFHRLLLNPIFHQENKTGSFARIRYVSEGAVQCSAGRKLHLETFAK